MRSTNSQRIAIYFFAIALTMAIMVGCVLESPEFIFPKPEVTLSSDKSTEINVSWDRIIGAGAYNVKYERKVISNGDFSNANGRAVNNGDETFINIEDKVNLVPEQLYEVIVEVKSEARGEVKQVSEIEEVVIGELKAPQGLITPLSPDNSSSIRFHWPPAAGATHYLVKVYWDASPDDNSELLELEKEITVKDLGAVDSLNLLVDELRSDAKYRIGIFSMYEYQEYNNQGEPLKDLSYIYSKDSATTYNREFIKTNELYPPTGIHIDQVGLDQMSVVWNNDALVKNYFLEVSSSPDFIKDGEHYYTELKVGSDSVVTVNGLTPSTKSLPRKYYARVYVQNDYTQSDPSKVVSVTTGQFHSPRNLQFVNKKNEITVSWDGVAYASHYDVELLSLDETVFKQAKNVADTFYVFRALKADQQFRFRVQAKNNKLNNASKSDFSEYAAANTEQVPAPTDFTVSGVYLTKLKVAWTPKEHIDKYRIYYYREGDSEESVKTKEVAATESETFIEGLEPDEKYQVRIVSVFEEVESRSTSILDNPVATEVLRAPYMPASENGYDTAQLDWMHRYDNIAPVGFEVLFDETLRFDAGEFRYGYSEITNFTTPNDLIPNGEGYKFKVRAVFEEGKLFYSDYSVAYTFATADLAVPEDLETTEEAIDALKFSWSPVDYHGQGAAGDYLLQYATKSDWSDSVNVTLTGETTFLAENLQKATTYKYRVKGLFKHFSSAWSAVEQGQTLGLNSPTMVGIDLTFNSMQPSWQVVTDATGYRLAIYEREDYSDEPVVLELSVNSYMLQNLQPATYRYFRLYSRFGNEYSDTPEEFSAQTLFYSQPSPPMVVQSNYTNIMLQWHEVVAGGFKADKYTLYWSATNDISQAIAIPVIGTSQTVSALQPANTYYFWLQAHYQQHQSPISEVQPVSTRTLEVPQFTTTGSTNPDEISLAWTAVPYSNVYEAEYSTDADFNTDVNVLNLNSTAYTLGGLQKNTAYYFRIRGVFEGNRSAFSTITMQETIDLATPENLREKSVDFYSMAIEWDAVSPVTSYTLFVSSTANNASAQQIAIPANTTTYNIADLSPGTNRYFSVRANYKGEQSGKSTEIRVSTLILVEPKGLALADATYNTMQASWEAVELATEYELEWSTEASFVSPQRMTLGASSLAHTITGLAPDQLYHVRFRAKVGDHYSQYSSVEQLKTPALEVPAVNEATAVTAAGFRTNWSATVMGYETEYEIWMGTTSSVGSEPTFKVGTANSYDFAELSKNKAYFYRVRGWYNSHYSEWSEPQAVNTLALVAPTNLAISNITFNSMDLSWDAEANANGYQLAWADEATFSNPKTTNVTGTSFKLTGLKAGTHWYFKLYSLYDTEKSDSFASADASTLDLAKPVMKTSTDVVFSGFTAHWELVENATSYTLQYSEFADFSTASERAIQDGDVGSLALTDLQPAKTYYVRVRAWITDHFSAFSDAENTTTEAIPAPDGLMISSITQDQFTISWLEDDFDEYEINISGGTSRVERAGSSTTYLVSNLERNTVYQVSVSGVYNGSYKVESTEKTVTTKDLLAPTNLAVDDVSFNAIDLSWNIADDAQKYELQYAVDAAFSSDPKTVIVSGSAFKLDNLLPGTKYYFRLRSVYNTQLSDYSAAITATSLALEKPVLTNIDEIDFKSAQANWNAVSNASRYTIEYATDASFSAATQIEVTDGSLEHVKLEGLMPNTPYHVRMRAWISDHFSAYSEPLNFTTSGMTAPSMVSISTVEQDGFTVSWMGDDFESYELHLSGGSTAVVNVGNNFSYTFTDLQKATDYSVQVYGLYGPVYKAESVVKSTTTEDLLAPEDFSISSVNFNEIHLQWTAAADAQSYELAYATDAAFSDQVLVTAISGTDYSLTSLLPGTTYHFKIRSVYNKVKSSYSSPISGGTDNLSTPVVTQLSGQTFNAFTAEWNTVDKATSYTIEYATDNAFTNAGQLTVTAPATSVAIPGLVPNTTYYVRMKAWVDGFATAYSNVLNTTTEQIAAPVIAATVTALPDALSFSWTGDHFESYEVHMTGPGMDETINVGSVNSWSYGSLTHHSSYTFTVSGVYATSYKVSSAAKTATTQKLNTPSGFTAGTADFNKITLNWAEVTNAGAYEIEYADNSGYTSSTLISVNGTSHTLNNLKPGTSYYFRIRSAYNAQRSDFSADLTASTLALEKPVLTTIDNIGFKSAKAHWNEISNASRYTVEFATDASFTAATQVEVADGTITSTDLTDLMPNTLYHVRMRAWISDHFSDYADVKTFTTTNMDAPTALVFSNVTQDAFDVSWTANDFDSYEIHLSGGKDQVINTGGSKSYRISNLELATAYTVKVVGLYGATYTVDGPTDDVTTKGLLAPTGFSVASKDFNNINLTWTAATDAQQYEIAYSVNADMSDAVVIADLTGTSHSLGNLLPGTMYYFTIRSVYNNVKSDFSAKISGATDAMSTPTITALKDQTFNQFAVEWNKVDLATSYTVEYATDNGFASAGQVVVPDGNLTTVVIPNLLPNTTYYVRMKAWVNEYSTAYSATSDITTSSIAKPAISSPVGSTPDALMISWTGTDFESYEVKVVGGSTNKTMNVGNVNTYTVGSLANNTAYTITVTGIYGSTYRVSSTAEAATTKTLSAPADFAVGTTTFYTIPLTWTANALAGSYEIEYSESAAFSPSTVIAVSGSSHSLENLNPGTTYHFRIRSVYNAEKSDFSAPAITATTETLEKPEIGSVTVNSYNDMTVAWPAVSGATSYRVEYSEQSNFTPTEQLTVGSTSANLTGLKPGTLYYIRLKAYISDHFSDYSDQVIATTSAMPIPSLSAATNITVDGFTANWQAIDYGPTDGYILVVNKDGEATQEINVGNVTAYPITGLEQSSTYYYTVKGVHNGHASAERLPKVDVMTSAVLAPAVSSPAETTYTSVKIEWTKNTGNSGEETGFLVKYGLASDLSDASVVNLDGNILTYSVEGLKQNETYYFAVASIIGGQISEYSTTISGTTKEVPVPTGLSLGSEILTEFEVQWDHLAEATEGYILLIAEQSNFSNSTRYNPVVGATSQTVTGLSNNTLYYVKLRAKADGALSKFTASESTTTQALGTVAAPTVSTPDYTSATVSWSAAMNANSYAVQFSEDNSFASYQQLPVGNVTSANLTGLKSATQYWVRIMAVHLTEETVSASNNFTTATLGVPDLSFGTVTESSIAVSWATVTDATGYQLEWAKDINFTTDKQTVTLSENSRVVSGLEDHTTYYFRARALKDGDVVSAYGTPKSQQTNQLPAPTGLAMSADNDNAGDRQVSFGWNAVPGATSYMLRRYDQTGTTLIEEVTTSVNNHTFNALPAASTYQFSVVAVGTNESQPSAMILYTTATI